MRLLSQLNAEGQRLRVRASIDMEIATWELPPTQNAPLCWGIHSKSGIPWILESADNFEFSAERLSQNAITISLSTLQLSILQCVINTGEALDLVLIRLA